MILLSSLCLRVKRNPLLGQKNSKSNNHIDMVCRVLLTGMDQKREKLIIGEKKESELLYTISTRLLLFFCIYFYTTYSSFSASPTPIFSLSLSLKVSHTPRSFFFSLAHNATTWRRWRRKKIGRASCRERVCLAV